MLRQQKRVLHIPKTTNGASRPLSVANRPVSELWHKPTFDCQVGGNHAQHKKSNRRQSPIGLSRNVFRLGQSAGNTLRQCESPGGSRPPVHRVFCNPRKHLAFLIKSQRPEHIHGLDYRRYNGRGPGSVKPDGPLAFRRPSK